MQKMLDKMYKDMEYFFRPYFNTSEEMLEFYNEMALYDNADRIPRQMMNQIYNLVTLANDIEKIRPARDSLRIVFLKTCLESLAKLSEKDNKGFFTTFVKMISKDGKNYILSNFTLEYFDEEYMGLKFDEYHKLTIDEFFNLIKVVRDMVMHEGNYWEMYFFSYDGETWLPDITTREDFLSTYQYKKKNQVREYHFQTTLNYEKFVFYFVEGCINYVKDYLQKRKHNNFDA